MKKWSFLWLLPYPFLVGLFLTLTPKEDALIHDAAGYLSRAQELVTSPLSVFTNISPSFIDQGYPFLLALLGNLIPLSTTTFYQLINYLLWALSSYFIYKSLVFIKSPKANLFSLLMLYSPLYLSFGAKLYSEPLSSLGISLLTWGWLSGGIFSLFMGVFALATTKSIFFPGIILLAIYTLIRRKFYLFYSLAVSILISLPLVISSYLGSRSLYNRAIQVSKTTQSYTEILSCSPYFVSYPLGLALLPNYQGVCHQNDPVPSMPGYESNPYVIAKELRDSGFSNQDWLNMILKSPLKYLFVMIVSLDNFLLFEGIYPSILTQLSPPLIEILFILTRVILSLYLWSRVLVVLNMKPKYLIPIFYLFVVIAHFQVEPRYIYPLIPYIYFLAGISHNRAKL